MIGGRPFWTYITDKGEEKAVVRSTASDCILFGPDALPKTVPVCEVVCLRCRCVRDVSSLLKISDECLNVARLKPFVAVEHMAARSLEARCRRPSR